MTIPPRCPLCGVSHRRFVEQCDPAKQRALLATSWRVDPSSVDPQADADLARFVQATHP